MKKKVLMSLVLLTMVAASAAFAQSQGRYYLEVYDIDPDIYKTLERQKNNTTITREDQYIFVRTDKWTSLLSKDRNLTLDQARQKLQTFGGSTSDVRDLINRFDQSQPQQRWGTTGYADLCGDQFIRYIFFWLRRTE
jgi:hypothetical protein